MKTWPMWWLLGFWFLPEISPRTQEVQGTSWRGPSSPKSDVDASLQLAKQETLVANGKKESNDRVDSHSKITLVIFFNYVIIFVVFFRVVSEFLMFVVLFVAWTISIFVGYGFRSARRSPIHQAGGIELGIIQQFFIPFPKMSTNHYDCSWNII